VRAVVLASRAGQRLAAVRLFEIALKDAPLAEEDQFTLARLWDAAGSWERAHSLMLDLLTTSPDNPQYLAFLARGLARHDDRGGARFYLDKLERIEPRSARTLELKGLLSARGTRAETSRAQAVRVRT
jgi:tetratricopeptide (TPR) repeat protein